MSHLELVLAFGAWIIVLGLSTSAGHSYAWKDWIPGLQTGPGGLEGAIGQPANVGTKLAYFGAGRAELGEYRVEIFDPITDVRLRTDFRLEGLTAVASEDAFRDFIQRNYRALREQVAVTLRTCDFADLNEPDFQLLEKKLLSRINRTLGRKSLKSVRIKDFQLYESVDQSDFVRQRLDQGISTSPLLVPAEVIH